MNPIELAMNEPAESFEDMPDIKAGEIDEAEIALLREEGIY